MHCTSDLETGRRRRLTDELSGMVARVIRPGYDDACACRRDQDEMVTTRILSSRSHRTDVTIRSFVPGQSRRLQHKLRRNMCLAQRRAMRRTVYRLSSPSRYAVYSSSHHAYKSLYSREYRTPCHVVCVRAFLPSFPRIASTHAVPTPRALICRAARLDKLLSRSTQHHLAHLISHVKPHLYFACKNCVFLN